jgi:hypothetical protein
MVNKMNVTVAASKAKCKKFTPKELLIGFGIIIGAAEFSQKWGGLIWSEKHG